MSLNIILIVVTVIVTIIAFNNQELFNKLKFNAYLIKERKEYGRLFSYALVHAGWLHLLINMYVLYSFGDIVEQMLQMHFAYKGILYFGLLYVGGVLFSTLYNFRKQKANPYYSAVGASGAVSAVVFSSILLYPEGSIFIFPIPFPMPSWVFGVAYLIYSAYMGKRGADNIGHNAHFWGAVFGIVFTVILIPEVVQNFFATVF